MSDVPIVVIGTNGATRNETSAPSAMRIWTGMLVVEKTGNTAMNALARRKTNSQLRRSGMAQVAICGIFSITAVVNSMSERRIQGNRRTMTPTMASALGTNV